jgi:thymidine kinase
MAGKVHLITGPMFSGKTGYLLQQAEREIIARRNIKLVRPLTDTRNFEYRDKYIGEGHFIALDTLDGWEALLGFDSVFVDEGQFFESLLPCMRLADRGVDVYIAALNATAEQRPWASVQEIIPLVDNITFLKSVCSDCGAEASFSFFPGRKDVDVVIGGSNTYVALCRACLCKRRREAGEN